MTPLRIALVGLKCYDLLADAPQPRYFGGAERQQVLLARGLSARGHLVSFVTLDEGQPDAVAHRDIRVYKAYARSGGVSGLRFFHPRWTGLARALRRSNPGIVYQMGADSETGQVAAWCRWHGRAFVFSMASDADTDPSLPLLRTRRQRTLYRAGLKRAQAVVAQTAAQRDRLRERFGLDATVIRNCTADPGFDPAGVAGRVANARPRLLWVGRFVPVKRLEIFLDLAAAAPAWDFHVVGSGDGGQPYVQALTARAATMTNVTIHRGVSDADLDEQYRRANALVSTSSMEGVPTTFLEAWARGLPVVSTLDPDGVIAAERLGAVTTPLELAASVSAVLGEDQHVLAARIRAHFLKTHTIDAFVERHEQLFVRVAAAQPPSFGRIGRWAELGRWAGVSGRQKSPYR